jgi:hypothetical protein
MRCLSLLFLLFLMAIGAFGVGYAARGGTPTLADVVRDAGRLVSSRAPAQQPAAQPAGQATPVQAGGLNVQRTGRDVTVQVDEATLTQQANATLAGQSVGDTPFGPATIRSLSVQLREGEVLTNGTAQVGPTIAPVNVNASVHAEAGRVRVGVTTAKVGGVPLPATMRSQIERELQRQLDQLVGQQRIQVQAVTVADGKLTATGTAA